MSRIDKRSRLQPRPPAVLILASVLAAAGAMPSVSRAYTKDVHVVGHGQLHHRPRHATASSSGATSSSATSSNGTSSSGTTSCANAQTPASAADVQATDTAVVCLLNEQRAQHGLPPFSEQSQLDASAQQWTNWMVSADDYTHGTDFGARITAAGYAWQAAGENIATGYPTPVAVVSAWMQSTDHCRNILSPVFRDVGSGVSPHPVAGVASGPATWTMDFGLAVLQAAPSQDWGPANGCPY